MATKWGVVSAGKICHDFVAAVRGLPEGEHRFVAVAARNLASAEAFAAKHGIPKSYGSYEQLAQDPDVEVVYVGVIGAHHFRVGRAMLEAGKHVLLEKTMTLNARLTRQLVDVARRHRRFLMEAVWSRFLPSYRHLMGLVRDGAVGEVRHVHADFGLPLTGVERLTRRALGGGSMLDLGIYPLNAISMVYGGEAPRAVAAVGHLNEDGVDMAVSCSLLYEGGRTATLATSCEVELPCHLIIVGTEGTIKVPNPMWCATVVEAPDRRYEFPLPETVVPCNFLNSSGLRYEAVEVRECLRKGLLESPTMPLKDSVLLAETIDEIRRQVGVVYDEDVE